MSRELSPEDVRRLETLFEQGAGLPPEEHAAFLDRECGENTLLRAELEDLLAGLAGEDILSQLQPGAPSREGSQIGSYKLGERVGQGGMGEVYEAEQLEPVQRRVAVKLIRPGMDSIEVVRRFHAERQALARMSHPNIAQVYDAGSTDDGRPYFVMEFVEGVALTEACDQQKLSTRQRIELFLDICEGIQHAHQKGIIHRDLKPSNLLVTQQHGRAVTKIIDFGVARATTGRLGDRSLNTMLGQVVGTLDYMSPEQADPSALDIDTRSDIYSLGVVLYQLITGLLPFEHSTHGHLPLARIQQAILEENAPTPSSRLRQTPDTATNIAPLHGTDMHTLVRQLTGDLDWICLKALEKDPDRRYASASELAQDLRRHLAHEPVSACRPSAIYRTRKFVRRNRLAVGASVLVLGAAVVGIYGVIEAESARIEADAIARIAEAQETLADGYGIRQLILEADRLWPPYPEQIPELRRWQENLASVMPRFEAYERELTALRRKSLERTPEERKQDETAHPDTELLQLKRADFEELIARLEDPEPKRQRRPGTLAEQLAQDEERALQLESEIEVLAREVERRKTWRFASYSDSARHALLSDLVDGMRRIRDPQRGLVEAQAVSKEFGWSVSRRLAFAEELARDFGPEGKHTRAWAQLREDDPDLDLETQMGLVPLGPDPVSGLLEFAHLQSGEPAQRDASGELVLTKRTGLVFVLVPGGTYTIGAQYSDPNRPYYDPDATPDVGWECPKCEESFPREAGRAKFEGPPVEVTVEPFFLSKYEMTQGQWLHVTGDHPSLYQEKAILPSLLNPVNQLDWHECVFVLEKLGLLLPTETQWEVAARAGTDSIWWQGDDPKKVEGTVNLYGREPGHPTIGIREIGSFPANPFGLHDMLGNVSEWCSNHPGLPGAETTPVETLELRAARGGSAREGTYEARSAARKSAPPGMKNPVLGIRPMLPISSSEEG